MINSKLSQLAIILLIAIFSIVACSGGAESIAGSRTVTPVEEPIDGPIDEPEDPIDDGKWDISETPGHEYFGSSYRSIFYYGVSSPWMRVSYNDTDRLTRMWKYFIDKGIKDGKHRRYIKTGDGDFFFDENYNIRWSKKPDVILKRFQGGVIVKLQKGGPGNNVHPATEYGGTWSGNWTIGGLYTYAMHLSEANRLNSDTVNIFFGSETGLVRKNNNSLYLYGGRMEILALHPGYPLDLKTGFANVNYQGVGKGWTGTTYGLQSYMAYNPHSGYMDGNHHLWNIKGNSPERYTPHMSTYQLYYNWGFRWAEDKVYDPATFDGIEAKDVTVSTGTKTRVNLKDIIIK